MSILYNIKDIAQKIKYFFENKKNEIINCNVLANK